MTKLQDEEGVSGGRRTTCSGPYRAHRSAPATALHSDHRGWPAAVRGCRAPQSHPGASSRRDGVVSFSTIVNLLIKSVIIVIQFVLRHGFCGF